MIRSCSDCNVVYDDEFRTTICPHEVFAANDGNNAFEIHHESKGPAPALGTFDPCPQCESPLNVGFGLTGGGYGAYTCCSKVGCNYFNKTQELIGE